MIRFFLDRDEKTRTHLIRDNYQTVNTGSGIGKILAMSSSSKRSSCTISDRPGPFSMEFVCSPSTLVCSRYCGFLLQYKDMHFCKLVPLFLIANVSMCSCSSACVSPVMNWQIIVKRLLIFNSNLNMDLESFLMHTYNHCILNISILLTNNAHIFHDY